MAVVFIEARPKGAGEGSPVEDYVVEDHADPILTAFKTQREAITWSKEHGHSPHVARSDISMTRRSPITGERSSRSRRPELARVLQGRSQLTA
jgi:hypothetical protein